jgi:hypothetical protein
MRVRQSGKPTKILSLILPVKQQIVAYSVGTRLHKIRQKSFS